MAHQRSPPKVLVLYTTASCTPQVSPRSQPPRVVLSCSFAQTFTVFSTGTGVGDGGGDGDGTGNRVLDKTASLPPGAQSRRI